MADKAISELVAASSITPDSLFVLQQDGTAKKLTAQVLENWLLSFADGHGGIQSYDLLKAVGLVKTYRFTLADQTHIDIDVMDGRGIESVKPTSTNGLAITYTITFNDSTTSTFTVTNGEKGEKGDNANIWIKYASQKPTASSHSFGDLPDAWIGVSSGHFATAPTDWQQYSWYQWKGEKGDTGDPAALVSSQVTYQVGDSGTIIPSGSWTTSVPPVTPGKFLWTRQVLQFNTGAPITSYSVSRFGIDGSGAVASVANVSPDPNGNVPLTAADVGALPEKGGRMLGPLDMNGQPLSGLNAPTAPDHAANKAYVDNLGKAKAGFIYPLASAVVPDGFLLCDGAAYSRTEYPELFAAIGTMYGEGDGSTTFNVPDFAQPTTFIRAYIIATGKDAGVSVSDIVLGAQAIPLALQYGGLGATNAADARKNLEITPENIGALSLELQWENASPSSSMAEQDIALNTDSEYYLVECYAYSTSYTITTLIRKGQTERLQFSSNASSNGVYTGVVVRDFTISDGKMHITNATIKAANSTSCSDTNTDLIPYRVFAVRGASA